MTGMFFHRGRIYYTVSGDTRLYYRYFTPESQIVGANLFVASTGDGVMWSKVRGMTMSSGQLVYATSEGKLWRVAFDDRPVGIVHPDRRPGQGRPRLDLDRPVLVQSVAERNVGDPGAAWGSRVTVRHG